MAKWHLSVFGLEIVVETVISSTDEASQCIQQTPMQGKHIYETKAHKDFFSIMPLTLIKDLEPEHPF